MKDDDRSSKLEVPLGALLGNLAAELSILQGDGKTLEDAIARSILGEEPNTSEILANLQSIDLIVQSLGELSDYIYRIADRVDGDECIDVSDVVSKIRLRDLARNLTGGRVVNTVDANGVVNGEIELF